MACQSPPSVDDLVRLCGLSDKDLNKEITRDRFHEIGPSLLEWRLLAPILNLTPLDVEDIGKIIVEKSRRETSAYQYGSGSSVFVLHTGPWWFLSARLRGGKMP